MRSLVAFVAGALILALPLTVSAQEFKPPANLFGQKKAAPKPPVIDWNWRPPVQANAGTTPTVVCGMTLVPADPKVDPKMKVAAPNGGVSFAMRVVPPTVCKPR